MDLPAPFGGNRDDFANDIGRVGWGLGFLFFWSIEKGKNSLNDHTFILKYLYYVDIKNYNLQ